MLKSGLVGFPRKLSNSRVSSTVQVSEVDTPTDIITTTPSIATRFPFHLNAFLFDSPPDPIRAYDCHKDFCKAISDISGSKIWVVDDVLKNLPHKQLRSILIDMSAPKFLIKPDVDVHSMSNKLKRNYIDDSLSKLSKDDLVDLILLNPSINIDVDNSSTGFSYKTIPVEPLSNLVFTRDQQIATSKGVVIGRFGAQQRLPENDLMSIFWPQIGVNPISTITHPAALEGGDFFSINKDISLIGLGSRTNKLAAQQLMDNDLLGTNRVVVLTNQYTHSQDFAHLDTVFNMLSEDTVLCLNSVAQDSGKYARMAHEYIRHDGRYIEHRHMYFGEWLKKEGFKVIEVTEYEQRKYFLDYLHLGKDSHGTNRILSGSKGLDTLLKKAGYKGEVTTIDFAPILAMHGGIHSATFCLRSK